MIQAMKTVTTTEQHARLAEAKIFFGHQSVGNDVIQGVRELIDAGLVAKMNLVRSSEPQSVSGPALVEAEIGRNCDPRSKHEHFTAVVDKGLGKQGGIALFKYCYVDITANTDIVQLFAEYRNCADGLKHKYPDLKIVHVTVPLRTIDTGVKGRIERFLRRAEPLEANRRRNEFSQMIREAYQNDPIFDLAAAESRRADGSRYFCRWHDHTVYMLAPELTADGGHLNKVGRRAVAEEFLLALANAQQQLKMQQPSEAN